MSLASAEAGGLPWTGERCLPWIDDVQVVYEHLHRYLFARPLAHGKRVLDLGSGEGYGAALLGEVAESVLGVEIDPDAVAHARRQYASSNLRFLERSILDLDGIDDHAFDLIVCFETIEHVTEHDVVMANVRRLLAPGGRFCVATPDRLVYTEAHDYHNPHHVRELSLDELTALLGSSFPHVRLWGQHVTAGSQLFDLGKPAGGEGTYLPFPVERHDRQWQVKERSVPVYLVAVASGHPLDDLPAFSSLVDENLTVVSAQALALRREYDPYLDELDSARAELEASRASAVDHVLMREQAARWAGEYQSVVQHPVWRAWEVARTARRKAGAGRRKARRLAAKAMYRVTGDWRSPLLGAPPVLPAPAPYAGEAFAFPAAAAPRVSIVVPVHQQVDYTWSCLRHLKDTTPAGVAELIVVDDASTDATAELLERSDGVITVRNAENLGFVASINRGAEMASGEHLVLLNNDTEVQPGWLEALLRAVESGPDVGAVGAKLVFPDGRLQEAGGIIWNDATGWNYGFGKDPEAPPFNHRREVDYCSGAALLVRRSLFAELGGFDRRFDPGFYEDVDLCFSLRAKGWRVLYEPTSVVVHHGGMTFGTDERRGVSPHSRADEHRNRQVFAAKWADELSSHFPPGAHEGLRGGRDRGAVSVLVCDEWVPTDDRDAGSLRMTWILKLLVDMGCQVTLFPRNRFGRQPYTARLQEAGVEVHHGAQPFASFAEERAGLYDVVLVSRPDVGVELLDDARRWFPDALLLYDTVDLHFLRERRRMALDGRGSAEAAAKMWEVETGLMRRSSATVVVTDAEEAVIHREVPGVRTVLLPTVHEPLGAVRPGFDSRAGLLFIGSFVHEPNVDAVEYLLDEIMPRIGRHQRLRLWVIGENPPTRLVRRQVPGVVFTGFVPDADTFLRQSRVFVAPIRYGAGIKGKIGHAMAQALPVVTTSVGAEGMGLLDEKTAMLRDDPEAFAEAVLRLHDDEQLWTSLAEEGLEKVRADWSPAATRIRLEALVRAVPVSARPQP